jgi:hypothetical protein
MNYIICTTHVYKYVEDYIKSILPIINAKLILNANDIIYQETNNYIFVQNIPTHLLYNFDSNNNVYLLNIEQLSNKNKYNVHIVMYNEKQNINIIDYSYANLKYYNNLKNKILYLPYQINYDEIIQNTNKTKDICLIGDVIPENRQNIINLLKEKNINVDIISGFGQKRDEELFKYKIILNISFLKDFTIFESIRCDRCIFNKMIVISDMKEDIEKYYLKDYVIFEEYENIPDVVVNVLHNYDYYHNKLFKNFNLEIIANKINELSKCIVEQLSVHQQL